MFARLLSDDNAATAIEYGLIAALISVALIIAFQALGLSLSETFSGIAGFIQYPAP